MQIRESALPFVAPLILLISALAPAQDPPQFTTTRSPGKVEITFNGAPFATYVYEDEKILRPYFANVHARSGAQVTRNHPPVEGNDATDHDLMHPGIWLAFSDINGEDFWRNKGRVVHDGFARPPAESGREVDFTVRNKYMSPSGKLVCTEECRYTISEEALGILMVVDTKISSSDTLKFGEQEEMGLGVRVATPITVKNGGEILNNKESINEAEVWGQDADWCDYSGKYDTSPYGILLMRLYNSGSGINWFHARDYGLLVSNPFRIPSFTGRMKVPQTIRPGESLNMIFGVLIHDGITFEDSRALYLRLGTRVRRIP